MSRWMGSEGVDVEGLSPRVVRRFLVERRQRYATEVSPERLGPLLDYLGGLGLLPVAEQDEPTAVDRVLEDSCRYLLQERGLVNGSVQLYAGVAHASWQSAGHDRHDAATGDEGGSFRASARV